MQARLPQQRLHLQKHTSKAAETGAAVGGALAVIALAGTAVIVAKRRK